VIVTNTPVLVSCDSLTNSSTHTCIAAAGINTSNIAAVTILSCAEGYRSGLFTMVVNSCGMIAFKVPHTASTEVWWLAWQAQHAKLPQIDMQTDSIK
jgi:hypothetical protein